MLQNKNKKKNFWKQVRFKYKLSFLNENTLEEVFTFHLSKLMVIVASFIVLVTVFILTGLIIMATPLKNYLPGYMDKQLRADMVNTAFVIDSLEQVAKRNDNYLRSIHSILTGNVNMDSVTITDTEVIIQGDSLRGKTQKEEDFVKQFEEEEKYNLSVFTNNSIATEGFSFYPPVKGVITRKFNPVEGHYGIDLLTPNNALVSSALDGTIIFNGYTIDSEYVIQIQHANDFISVYKFTSQVYGDEGKSVIAGQAIGVVADKSAEYDSPHLHFELWHKGTPRNPEDYITF